MLAYLIENLLADLFRQLSETPFIAVGFDESERQLVLFPDQGIDLMRFDPGTFSVEVQVLCNPGRDFNTGFAFLQGRMRDWAQHYEPTAVLAWLAGQDDCAGSFLVALPGSGILFFFPQKIVPDN